MKSAVVACAMLAQVALAATLPKRMSGFYCLFADDTVKNYTSTDVWQPNLYDYQLDGANVVFMTFVNPALLPALPPAMEKFAKCKGQNGCMKKDVPLMVSIGGEAYSRQEWAFLASQSAAEAMAEKVAAWADFGVDGIDLDIEGLAGSTKAAGVNLMAFAKKLRALKPDLLLTQPVYGSPGEAAEDYIVNNGWTNSTGPWTSTGLVDRVGIMLYSGLQSLRWVKDYAAATKQWDGFPIHVDVPTPAIVAGIDGQAADSTVMSMANAVVSQNLGGYMVWFASVFDATNNRSALTYGKGQMDSSEAGRRSKVWAQAAALMNK